MKKISLEQKQEKKNNYIPVISFLLAAPVGVASAMLTYGAITDFAVLNDFIPKAEAWFGIGGGGGQGSVTFGGDALNQWGKTGTYKVTDCDCHYNHSSDDDDDDDDGA